MSPIIAALLKIHVATRNDMEKRLLYKAEKQSDEHDRPHLWRLVCVGRVLFMYLIDKLRVFVGKLFCAEDHNELRLGNESSIMLREKDPCEKFVFELALLLQMKIFRTSSVDL